MQQYKAGEASGSNQYHRFTPRDLRHGSGIYFKHTYARDIRTRDNTHYTPADHKKKYEKENQKTSEKEVPTAKPEYQTVTVVANLPLVRVSYEAHILTTTTRTVLTQSFYHPGNAPIDEATYSFPLYAGCSVVSFVCHVGSEKVITGVVQPKKIAKATYEKAKSQGHTAGLLEEFTPEIFKTSLGNIPARVTVRVEITYLTELKHDTKVDGIRFTVPTSIAPRYGEPPEGLFGDEYETRAEKGVSFSIDITMGERIRTIESPSHKISVQLGTHKATTKKRPDPVDRYNGKKALVTLSQKSMHLRGDFVLLVATVTPKFLCTPMALLEEHPTIPGQQALMVTLVPHFVGPKSSDSQKPEIIFIVDQSGSMEPMAPPLKSAVSVFIKSLPIGCKFNICSFGSDYSFLWERSQDYSAHSVKAALKLVDSLDAEMGGTEMLRPIQEAVRRRLEDMNTEVIVLTDGEIWEEDKVLGFIKQATGESKGKLRFFSVGLGSEVSHSLVEGIARTGGGYSEIVADGSDEQDAGGWEGKLVKMLKATLTEHVDHYSLQVVHEGFHETDSEDSDEEEPTPSSAIAPGTANAGKSTVVPQAPKKVSLFDPSEDVDMTPETPPSDDELLVRRSAVTADPALLENRFTHLKSLENPEILQTPYKIRPLYPQVRTVAYLLISPTGDRFLRNPTSVKLRGTASGTEMEQSIPITRLDESGLTIHQLAARMALRDLEDGSSWLHSGKYGIDPKDDSFQEYVEREGESLSIKWGLASKWASFVAVEEEFLENEATEKAAAKASAKPQGKGGNSDRGCSSDDGDGYTPANSESNSGTLEPTSAKTPDTSTERPMHPFGTPYLGEQPLASIAVSSLAKVPPPPGVSAGKMPRAFNLMHSGHDSMSMLLQPRDVVADDDWNKMLPLESADNRIRETLISDPTSPFLSAAFPPRASIYPISEVASLPSPAARTAVSAFSFHSRRRKRTSGGGGYLAARMSASPSGALYYGRGSTEPEPEHNQNDTPHQKIVKIIRLQEFMGSFPVTGNMAQLIGLELPEAEKLTKELLPDKVTDENKTLAMTALVVAYLELKMREHEDIWQIIVEKAHRFMEEGCERVGIEVEVLKEKAEGVIEGKKVLNVSASLWRKGVRKLRLRLRF